MVCAEVRSSKLQGQAKPVVDTPAIAYASDHLILSTTVNFFSLPLSFLAFNQIACVINLNMIRPTAIPRIPHMPHTLHLDSNSQASNFSLSTVFKMGRGIHGQASFVSLSPNMDFPTTSHLWELFSRVRASPWLVAPHENRKNFIKPHDLLPRLLYLKRGVNNPYSTRSTLPLLRYIHDGDRVDSFSQLTHTPCASTVWFTSGSSNCPYQDSEGQMTI